MKLISITEPTATITLTLTELCRISDAHGWAIECLEEKNIDLHGLEGLTQEHQSLKNCVDTVIADLEDMLT